MIQKLTSAAPVAFCTKALSASAIHKGIVPISFFIWLLLVAARPGLAQTGPVTRIPVVVHVLYLAGRNIPDATVQGYIRTINENFRKQRPALFPPRAIFDSLWVDTKVELCLATTSPTGQATSGITHTLRISPLMGGDFGDDAKYTSSSNGGIDPWPVARYLNIWLGPFGSLDPDFAGITVNNNIFANPGAPREGIVVNSAFAGVITNVLTHEVGHFAGLFHTFDNASEGVDDTPYEGSNHIQRLRGTPCDPADLTSNTSIPEAAYWGNNNPPDMVENFMGYDIPCQFMFTKGQRARMKQSLAANYAVLTSQACGSTVSDTRNSTAASSEGLKIWPNPATAGEVMVTVPGAAVGRKYTIINLLGACVASGTLTQGTMRITLGLPQGAYVFRAERFPFRFTAFQREQQVKRLCVMLGKSEKYLGKDKPCG